MIRKRRTNNQIKAKIPNVIQSFGSARNFNFNFNHPLQIISYIVIHPMS